MLFRFVHLQNQASELVFLPLRLHITAARISKQTQAVVSSNFRSPRAQPLAELDGAKLDNCIILPLAA
jgi:hypothetical protein